MTHVVIFVISTLLLVLVGGGGGGARRGSYMYVHAKTDNPTGPVTPVPSPQPLQPLPESEQQGLLALSRSVSGVSGNSTNPCEWVGVTCSPINDTLHVTGLVYDVSDSLNGTFATDSLQSFPYLRIFNIEIQSRITGIIPSFSSNPELVEINILGTNIGGAIPDKHFQNNPRLHTLFLVYNQFTGPLPDFSYCRGLNKLDVSDNGFVGVPSDVSMLTNLTHVNYGDNQLTGPLPMFDTNLQLTEVSLGNNQFTIPPHVFPNYCHLTQLQILDLNKLRIQAPLPTSFGCLSHLQRLYLRNNALYGSLSHHIFVNTPELQWLSLDSNNLTGVLPSFYNCTQLKQLELQKNHFQSPIANNTFRSEVEILDLSNNDFQGELAIDVLPRNLTFLILSYNQFNGTLPNDPFPASQFPSLIALMMKGNQFSGPLPAFPSSYRLKVLWAEKNQFTGSLPSTLPASLQEINLNENQLTGPIPSWYGSSPTLERLELSRNQLTGPLPSFASSRAHWITLSRNLINGSVESAKFPCSPNSTSTSIWIDCNRMAGNACPTWNPFTVQCYDGITACGPCPNPFPTIPPTTPPTPFPPSSPPSGGKNGGVPLTSPVNVMLIVAITSVMNMLV